MEPFTERPDDHRKSETLLKEQLRFQKELNEVANRIHSAKDTNDILLNLQDDILSIFDAERITVYVVDGIRRQIVSRFKSGNEISEIRLPIGDGSIAGYCAASGCIINVYDAYDRTELASIHQRIRFDERWDQKTGFKTRQVLAAPILHDGYLMGVIQLINKKRNDRFTQMDCVSASSIAKVLGIAFHNNKKLVQRRKTTRYDFLISNNILGSGDLEKAMRQARTANTTVESVLMREFGVSREDLGNALAHHYKARFIPFSKHMAVPKGLLKGLRPVYLQSHAFVPIEESPDRVLVTMEDPQFLPARDAVRRVLPGRKIEYAVSLKDDILKMVSLFFSDEARQEAASHRSFEEILNHMDRDRMGDGENEDDSVVTENDSAIVQLVNKIIIDAHHQGASDIHFEPGHQGGHATVRLRVDGACKVYQTIPSSFRRAIVSRLKIMSDLDISEKRLPQDGKIKFRKFAPLNIELRVATIPTAGGNEDVVLRILPGGEPLGLHELGMAARNFDCFSDLITKPYGMLLVAGPTGSGKTTTLHAALARVNQPEMKIWTAEDPVEISHEGLRQVQVKPKIGLNFSAAMRAFLRADPDIIMVGEIRDRETASMAIEASLTGHLVFSTLHTNSASETVVRLLDMGMDPFNFSDALLGVLAQRLVKTLCEECREPYQPSEREFEALAHAYGGGFETLGVGRNEATLYRAHGCHRCGRSGYRGRSGIYELLLVSEPIRALIQSRARVDDIRTKAVTEGMTTLMQDGIRKVFLGHTDLAQVRRVCMR
jgi:type II secretory ATPase GspE/PulE/Tfp pilus assembly ATPase PilB-like protein